MEVIENPNEQINASEVSIVTRSFGPIFVASVELVSESMEWVPPNESALGHEHFEEFCGIKKK